LKADPRIREWVAGVEDPVVIHTSADQDLGLDAVFIEEWSARATGQMEDRTHQPIVPNIIDARAALVRGAGGFFGRRDVAKRAEISP